MPTYTDVTVTDTGKGIIDALPKTTAGAQTADSYQLRSVRFINDTGYKEWAALSTVWGMQSAIVLGGTTAANCNNGWAILGQVYQGTAVTNRGQHVGVYGQGVRTAFHPSNADHNSQMWGGCFEVKDTTNQPSSVTNANLAIEADIVASGMDDAGTRQIVSLVAWPTNDASPGYGTFKTGLSMTANYGSDAGSTNRAYIVDGINFGGGYLSTLIDMRNVNMWSKGGSGVAITANSSGTTISLANIIPFTVDNNGADLNGAGTLTVYFSDGTSATAYSYAITGTGGAPAGTLTLSAAKTVTTAMSVNNNSAAIWLETTLPIKFDTAGNTSMRSPDGSNLEINAGNIKLSGNTLTLGDTIKLGTTGQLLWSEGVQTLFVNGQISVPSIVTNAVNMVNGAFGLNGTISAATGVGFSTKNVTIGGANAAFRMGSGQKFVPDDAALWSIRHDSASDRIKFAYNGVDVMSVDTSGRIRTKSVIDQNQASV